ncbi:hypothetical protein H5410_026589, partial [Solanum commersonii]
MASAPINWSENNLSFTSSMNIVAYDLIVILEELQINCCMYLGHSLSAMIGVVSIFRHDLSSKFVFVSSFP